METRELYTQKYQAKLNEWSAKLDVVKARVDGLSAQASLDMKPHMQAVHAKFESAKAKLAEIAGAAEDTWSHVAEQVDHAWGDFSAAAEGAYAALGKHSKS
jgi:hypothetical protein